MLKAQSETVSIEKRKYRQGARRNPHTTQGGKDYHETNIVVCHWLSRRDRREAQRRAHREAGRSFREEKPRIGRSVASRRVHVPQYRPKAGRLPETSWKVQSLTAV